MAEQRWETMPPVGDPYRLLGVSRLAGPREVRRAFRRLVLQHHPDRNPSDPTSVEQFKIVVEAYRRINRRTDRSPPVWRRAPGGPDGAGLYQPRAIPRHRGVSANLPVRWKRAASGFVYAHGKSIPIVLSMILSGLITAAGLLSEGGLAS